MIDEALLGRVQKQAWFHKYPRGWPFLLFLSASIGTAVSVIAIERADQQTREIELDRNLIEIASALQRRITENMALLRAGSALFSMQENVTATQFAEFSSDLQSKGDLYGSLGLGWAPLISASRVPAFEVGMRDAGTENFYIRPASTDQSYATPIVFLEPRSRSNNRAIGYDMYSESARRQAMNLSIELGKPVASGKVNLIQDRDRADQAGFMIYMPVVAMQGGRRVVKGFVYSPFRAEDFLDSAAELYRNDEIEVAVFDRTDEPENLLVERRVEGVSGMTIERQIDVANHVWVIRVSDKKAGLLSTLSRITLFFGIIAWLMIMIIGRLITRRSTEDRRVLEWLSSEASIRNSLTRELNHRVKNTLANVLSIAALTRRRATDIDDFTESLTARIRALSATHDLLSQTNWSNAPLGDVIRSELAPYMEGSESHVVLAGPEIRLAPNDAMSLGLAIHELATNAAKYGALSSNDGRIHVTWKLIKNDLAQIHWREEGGPTVVEPTKRGFGRDLIEKIVAHELRSQVDLQFRPDGVECKLQVLVRHSRAFALRGERRDGQ